MTAAVNEAQQPLVGVLEELRRELALTRRELQELRDQSHDEPRDELIYLSLPQVAERLGVSRRTARRWIRAGKLPHVRLPSGVRVSVANLDHLLNQSLHQDADGDVPDERH